MTEGWKFDELSQIDQITENEGFDINRKSTITHRSTAVVEEIGNKRVNVHHFSFPFDFQFLSTNESYAQRPYMLFQVNSVDWLNRHRIEGYGFVRMSVEAGTHDILIQTWKPRSSLDTQVHQFFLGGSIRIMKLEEIVRSYHIDQNGERDIVNRFGLETEDGGTVRIRINVANQNFEYKKEQKAEYQFNAQKEKMEIKRRLNEAKLEAKRDQMKKGLIDNDNFA